MKWCPLLLKRCTNLRKVTADIFSFLIYEAIMFCKWDYPELGTGATDSGYYSGFTVNLNPLIFPVPSDSVSDVTFTTVVRVIYEGFGNDRPTRRFLAESNVPVDGHDTLYLSTQVKLTNSGPRMNSCASQSNTNVWAAKMNLQSTDVNTFYQFFLNGFAVICK